MGHQVTMWLELSIISRVLPDPRSHRFGRPILHCKMGVVHPGWNMRMAQGHTQVHEYVAHTHMTPITVALVTPSAHACGCIRIHTSS